MMIKKINIRIISVLFLFIMQTYCIFSYSQTGIGKKLIIFSSALLVVALAFLIYIKCRNGIFWGRIKNIYKQLFLIALILFMFFCGGYFCVRNNMPFSFRPALILNFLAACLYVCVFFVYKNDFYFKKRQLGVIGIITILTIIPRLFMLGTIQRWDAGEYIYALGNACKNFNFTLSQFKSDFTLCNHTTWGFSVLYGIGEFFDIRGGIGILIINLILAIASTVCLYKLTNEILEISSSTSGIMSLLYTFTPFVLGGFGYITPDHLIPTVLIIALYCEYSGNYILQLFWLIVLANTKENTIFIIFGYFIGKLIYNIFVCIKDKSNIRKRLVFNYSLWNGVLCACAFLLCLHLKGGLTWKGGNPEANTFSFNSKGVNCFGVNPDYIIFKLKQNFVLNFAWLILLLLILVLFIYVIKKYIKKNFIPEYLLSNDNKKEVFISVGSWLLFSLVFSCFYITAGAYKYSAAFFAVFTWWVMLIVTDVIKGKKLLNVITSVIIVLFIINSFIHIDPVSRLAFQTVSTGDWYTVQTNYTHDKYGNDLCNNYQYTWLDRALNRLLNEINYDGTSQIVITTLERQGSQINGNRFVYQVCWDLKKHRRVFYDDEMLYENDNLVMINCIASEDLPLIPTLTDKAYLLFIPYYEEDEEETIDYISNFYKVGERKKISEFGGCLYYYELELR